MQTSHQHTSQERNKNYFQSFIATRSSLGLLIIGIAGAAISGICYGIHSMTAPYYGIELPKDILSQMLIFCIFFMIVSSLVNPIEPLRRFFYRYQRFSSIWQFLFVFLLYFSLAFLCAILFLTEENMLNIYGSLWSIPSLICGSFFYFLCLLYNVRWLRTELSKGMSEEREQKNFLAKSSITSPVSLLLIFGLTMLAPILIKGSMEAGLGLSLFVLFTGAFSRLHVEYAYAAILKWRDKEYWEEYRREDGIGGTSKKTKSFIRIFLEVLFIIGLAYLRTEILPVDSPLIPILKIIPRLILVYWGLRIVIWGYRKIKNRKNSTE